MVKLPHQKFQRLLYYSARYLALHPPPWHKVNSIEKFRAYLSPLGDPDLDQDIVTINIYPLLYPHSRAFGLHYILCQITFPSPIVNIHIPSGWNWLHPLTFSDRQWLFRVTVPYEQLSLFQTHLQSLVRQKIINRYWMAYYRTENLWSQLSIRDFRHCEQRVQPEVAKRRRTQILPLEAVDYSQYIHVQRSMVNQYWKKYTSLCNQPRSDANDQDLDQLWNKLAPAVSLHLFHVFSADSSIRCVRLIVKASDADKPYYRAICRQALDFHINTLVPVLRITYTIEQWTFSLPFDVMEYLLYLPPVYVTPTINKLSVDIPPQNLLFLGIEQPPPPWVFPELQQQPFNAFGQDLKRFASTLLDFLPPHPEPIQTDINARSPIQVQLSPRKYDYSFEPFRWLYYKPMPKRSTCIRKE